MYDKLQGASWKTDLVFQLLSSIWSVKKFNKQKRQNVVSSEFFISKVRITVSKNTSSPQKNRFLELNSKFLMTGTRVQKDWLRFSPKEIKRLKKAAIPIEKIEYLGSTNWKVNEVHICKGNMGGAITFLREH